MKPLKRPKAGKRKPSEPITTYPRRWLNTTSKKEIRVMPWWETVKDGEIEKVDEMGQMISESIGGRPCKFGILVQIGYLLENEFGVWFGVGPKAATAFKDLGEWKEQRK